MDERQRSEMKAKTKNAAEETARKAAAAGAAAAEKADELYNKLPLDQINEKLGGKVDVKSKKFKIIAACVLAGLVVILTSVIIVLCSQSKSSWDMPIPSDPLKYHENLLASKKLFCEYGSVILVCQEKNDNIPIKFDEETYREYITRCKKTFNEKEMESYKKHCDEGVSDAAYEALKQSYETCKKRTEYCKILMEQVPDMINRELDESFDTCTEIKVKPGDFSRAENSTEWYWGVASIYNSQTGKTRERNVEMWIDVNTKKIFVNLRK